MKEILYSIRHTQDWDSDPVKIGEHADQGNMLSKEELSASFKALLNKYENESKFIPVLERLKIADELISKTVSTAEKLELDVDIERNDGSVDFCFYDSSGLFQGELKDFFGELFIICDSVSMFKDNEGSVPLPGIHWIVDFTFYTHHHLVAGKEISLLSP